MSKPNLTEGTKFDQEKPRYDLISSIALNELAKVYTYGVGKYDDHNWRKGIHWSRIFSAIMRHLWAWLRGENTDPESGLPHLAHAAWGCFTLLEYAQTHQEFDDRYVVGEDENSGVVEFEGRDLGWRLRFCKNCDNLLVEDKGKWRHTTADGCMRPDPKSPITLSTRRGWLNG